MLLKEVEPVSYGAWRETFRKVGFVFEGHLRGLVDDGFLSYCLQVSLLIMLTLVSVFHTKVSLTCLGAGHRYCSHLKAPARRVIPVDRASDLYASGWVGFSLGGGQVT